MQEVFDCVFWRSSIAVQLLNDDFLSDPSTEFNDDLKNSDNV